jgi:hypothetical protein
MPKRTVNVFIFLGRKILLNKDKLQCKKSLFKTLTLNIGAGFL